MKIYLGVVGRLKEAYFVAAEDEYRKRLRPYCTLTVHEAKDEAGLVAALPEVPLYVFDERGESLTSLQFAELLREPSIAFAIGGADGHSDAVRKRAKRLLGFGKLTIAHRLVRILVLEQIYRGFRILRGEPYHRE